MPFKRIIGVDSETVVETKIMDGTGKILEKWKTLIDQYAEQAKIINDKYGLNLIIKRKKLGDLDWLK